MDSLEIIARGRAKKEAQAPYTKAKNEVECNGEWCRRNKHHTGTECGKCQKIKLYYSQYHTTKLIFDPEDLIILEMLGIHHTY